MYTRQNQIQITSTIEEEAKEIIYNTFYRVTGISEDEIYPDTDYIEEFGLDDLDMIELMIEIDRHIEIKYRGSYKNVLNSGFYISDKLSRWCYCNVMCLDNSGKIDSDRISERYSNLYKNAPTFQDLCEIYAEYISVLRLL